MPEELPVNRPDAPQVLAETPYLRLIQQGHWTYAQRPNIAGAIAIAAVTDTNEMVLVDQYRIPVGRRVIELPAGLVGDEPGRESESWEEAARRELLEEVGYRAGRIELLTLAVSSAGLTDEAVHLLRADGLQQVHAGGGHPGEDIVVCHVPLARVPSWLIAQQQAGKQVDYKVYAALFFLLHSQASG